METRLIIERLGRSGEVHERLRRDLPIGESLRIGRGYDADCLLDDPHVAELHAVLERDAEGTLWLSDAGSLNGLFKAGERRRQTRLPVSGRLDALLGHTHLRIFDGIPPVEPERALPTARLTWQRSVPWLLLGVGLGGLTDWLKQLQELRVGELLIGGLVACGMVLVWSFIWSLVTRLFAGELRFHRHLQWAAQMTALANVLPFLLGHLAYASGVADFGRFAYALYWAVFALTCWRHLRIVGPAHPRLKLASVATLAVVAIAMQTASEEFPRRDAELPPRFLDQLQPVAFRLRPASSLEGFIDRAAALEAELEAQRALAD